MVVLNMAKKKNKKKAEFRNRVVKEQIESGLFPHAKSWGKNDISSRQDRQRTKRELKDGKEPTD